MFLKDCFINPDSLCLLREEIADFAYLGEKCTHQFSFLFSQVLTWMQQVLKMQFQSGAILDGPNLITILKKKQQTNKPTPQPKPKLNKQ